MGSCCSGYRWRKDATEFCPIHCRRYKVAAMMSRIPSFISLGFIILVFINFFNLPTLSWADDYDIGTNVTLTFHHELKRTDEPHFVDAFVQGSDESLVVINRLDASGLKPGQKDRFRIERKQDGRNVTFQIIIMQVEIIDKGVYVVTVIGDGVQNPSTYTASVHVIYPQGKADCQVNRRIYPDTDWLSINCNASLSSDGSGALACFQNTKRLPHLQQLTTDATVTVIFWMDPAVEAHCCSAIQYADIHEDSCKDFVYDPPAENTQTTYQSTTSRILTTSIAPSTERTTFADSGNVRPPHDVFLTGVVCGLLIFVMLVVYATYRWRRHRHHSDTNERLSGKSVYDPV